MDQFEVLNKALDIIDKPQRVEHKNFIERAYRLAVELRDGPFESQQEFRQTLSDLCDLLSLELTK